jgi:hypothetical protein
MEIIDGECWVIVEEDDPELDYLASRQGVLIIARHYLLTMLNEYRNGDLLEHIVWNNDEEE